MYTTNKYRVLGWRNKLARVVWGIAWLVLYRPSPRGLHGVRRMVLRVFGAKIGKGAHPYPAARIWAPWNLVMGDHSCISDFVDCYCVDKVELGDHAVVSQYSFLCTASHDYNDPGFLLVTSPIKISAKAWVAADVFNGPGVEVGEGAVIGARSCVIKNVAAWDVVVGNPAMKIKTRAAQ